MTDTLTTRTSRYRLRPDGIIVQEIQGTDTQTLADARENIAAFNRLAAAERRPCLVDMQVNYSMERGVREYYGSPEACRWCSAVAMVVRSGFTRVIGNLVLALNTPPVPLRMFSSVADATAWLLKFEGARRP